MIILRYDVVKCSRNLNFEKMDTGSYIGTKMDFDYCGEYLRSTSNKILVRQC